MGSVRRMGLVRSVTKLTTGRCAASIFLAPGLLCVCAVIRRRFPVGVRRTSQPFQPKATGALMEPTKWLKPEVDSVFVDEGETTLHSGIPLPDGRASTRWPLAGGTGTGVRAGGAVDPNLGGWCSGGP